MTEIASAVTGRRMTFAHAMSSPFIGGASGLAVLVAVWYAVSVHRLVPAPHATVEAVIRQFHHAGFAPHFWWTMKISLAGFTIGAVVGVAIGLLLGASTVLRQIFAEPLFGLASVPKLILYPIVISILKLGASSEIAFVALSAVFLVLINTMTGAREVSHIHLKVGRAFNLSRRQAVAKIYLPSIAPSLVTGLRLGFSMALVHAVLAEMAIGNDGVGTQIWLTYRTFDIAALYGIVVLVAVVGIAGNILLWYLEKKLRGGEMQRVLVPAP